MTTKYAYTTTHQLAYTEYAVSPPKKPSFRPHGPHRGRLYVRLYGSGITPVHKMVLAVSLFNARGAEAPEYHSLQIIKRSEKVTVRPRSPRSRKISRSLTA